MDYTFSFGWFFAGLVISIAGVVFMRFYREIADNMASGVASYDRFKLFGIIACVVGILTMANITPFILQWIVSLAFPGI